MFFRRPTGLQTVVSDAGVPIARLNSLEGFSRSLLVGVLPLIALEALGSKQAVSSVYLLAALLSLLVTINFGTLERLFSRRWVVTLGGGLAILSPLILFFSSSYFFALGIALQMISASLFTVCISLYIMDFIGKKGLTRCESRRMLFNGCAWLIGPTLGVWLWHNTLAWTPFLLVALASASMLTYFWYLRLGDNEIVRPARQPSTSLIKIIPRYFAQPALRIAYLITLSRSVFWAAMFIYGPIYVVEAGMPVWMAGGLLSFVSGLLLLSPMVQKLADRFYTRTIIVYSLVFSSLSISGLFFLGEPQPVGLLFWVVASIGCMALDVLGNIPFMRMVKPRERTEMTMIFSTWRETSQLLTPLLGFLVLLLAPFQYFYLLVGGLLLVTAIVSTFLPRRL